MEAVLHIEITSEILFTYEKPLLAYIQQHFPQVTSFDMDNHSDTMLVGYAIQLLEEASRVLVIIDAQEGKTQTLLAFFEKLLAHQHKSLVIYNGVNITADRYIHLLADEYKRNNCTREEVQTSIQAFFQKMPF